MTFGECPTVGYLSHFGNINFTSFFSNTRIAKKSKTNITLHLGNVPLLDLCPILGTASTKLLNKT